MLNRGIVRGVTNEMKRGNTIINKIFEKKWMGCGTERQWE